MLNAKIPWQFNYKCLGVTLDRNHRFKHHIERVRRIAISFRSRLDAMLGRKSKLSLRNKRTIHKMYVRTAMTYASLVFAHAAPKALNSFLVIQNKYRRVATDALWCVQNSVLHRDLEILTIAKYMKEVSKRFFNI
ncbi:RNA-directed DNA polymerase from mobile element jockey [Eumeta japonica]|uniref:RNA-directed DNA polymerase from mobile element jockey n=1 Tax=Eumeta variegata TaxID=151549 RepID=A0A4C1U4K3_EUMVA|nr:RNA-directed DNA polymerase from mobile element jockey [Eumeta japonica]